ncbi:MAG TPA: hypothetical protein VMF35_01360 [Acidimicrobiales bacterium]|nr:hypothetical protein [Acidimicrobiales bacterium]
MDPAESERRCVAGHPCPPDAKYCPECGRAVFEASPQNPPSATAPESSPDPDLRLKRSVRRQIFAGIAVVLAIVVVVVVVELNKGGHSAQWNRGYQFGLGSDTIPGAAPSETGSGNNIKVAFDPSAHVCTSGEVTYMSDLNGAGGVTLPETRLAASEPHPSADFLAGCVAGVEQINASFVKRHGMSTSCADWDNASGLLPGC